MQIHSQQKRSDCSHICLAKTRKLAKYLIFIEKWILPVFWAAAKIPYGSITLGCITQLVHIVIHKICGDVHSLILMLDINILNLIFSIKKMLHLHKKWAFWATCPNFEQRKKSLINHGLCVALRHMCTCLSTKYVQKAVLIHAEISIVDNSSQFSTMSWFFNKSLKFAPNCAWAS